MAEIRINQNLLPLKAHYFFFFGSMAPVLPFIMVVAVQLGIPVPLQGSLSAFTLLFTIAGKPLVAALADIFPSYRKTLFLCTIIVMVAAFSSIIFIPSMQEPIEVEGTLVRVVSSSPRSNSRTQFSEVSHKSTRDNFTNMKSIAATQGNISNFITSENNHLPILLSPDERSNDIALGWDCKVICKSPWFCSIQTKTTKAHKGFTLKPISDSSGLQVVPIYSEVSTSKKNVFSTAQRVSEENGKSQSANTGHLYQLSEADTSWNMLNNNISIICARVEWKDRNRGLEGVLKTWQFWVFAVLLVVGQMAFNTAVSITDAIAVDTVDDEGAYGVQRAWGTIGWGVLAPISGLLIDWWSGSSLMKDYAPAFLLCFLLGVADIFLSLVSLKVPQIREESNILRNLWPLLKESRFFVFCCFVILNGCFDGIIVNYIFIMQEDMATGTSAISNMKFLQGLTVLVQGAVEAPFMFVYGWFMKKLGAQKVTSLVFFLYVFRLLGLYVAGQSGQVWTTLIPELLNGPCYGLGYTAIVVYAAKITPEGTSNTVQSVVNICYESFGYALAMFVGGLVYGQIGGPKMYLIACAVATVTFILHIISLRILPPPKEDTSKAENISSQDASGDDPEVITALQSGEYEAAEIE